MQDQKLSTTQNQQFKRYIYTFHITARTYNDRYFERPVSQVWKECLKELQKCQMKFPIDIISFVLMSNHYHLLIKGPAHVVQSFLKEFKLSYFKEYKYEVIQSKKYLFHTYKYIYQNPIRANLVKRAENYPYSSMYYLSRKKSFSVPLVDKYGFNDEFKMTWLNQSDFP